MRDAISTAAAVINSIKTVAARLKFCVTENPL